jgi:hypothetical protein
MVCPHGISNLESIAPLSDDPAVSLPVLAEVAADGP